MAITIYQQRLMEKRKTNGLCLNCGNPLDREGVYCVKCRNEKTEQEKLSRRWYQEHGICPRCGKNDLFGDEKICLECNQKAYEITMRSRERLGTEHYNSIHAEWARNEHKRRIENGICTRCGRRRADDGYKTCGICRDKVRSSKQIRYGKPDRKERHKQGLCFFCDNPIKDGYRVCEKHYQMNVEKANSEKAKESRKALKSIFSKI